MIRIAYHFAIALFGPPFISNMPILMPRPPDIGSAFHFGIILTRKSKTMKYVKIRNVSAKLRNMT